MDAAAWDARYDTSDLVWSAEPNRFLPPEVADLAPGCAIDLACGEGRNAIWLAEQGWDVVGVDFSRVAVAKAATLADRRGVSVRWEVADLTGWQAPETGAELVVVFYLQLAAPERAAVISRAAAALAPGGTFLFVAHDLDNLTHGVGGPQDPSVLPTPDAVVADLAATGLDLEVERAERVRRAVVTDDGEATAIDCLVRARRR